MIYDAALLLANAQSSTVAAASTDYIDTVAAGNDYKGCLFVAQVTTAFTTGAGAPTMQFLLQTSAASTFSDSATVTLAASALFLASDLTLGKKVILPIPPGARRYIRGYFNPSASSNTVRFNTTGVSMFILEDTDVTIDKRTLATSSGA